MAFLQVLTLSDARNQYSAAKVLTLISRNIPVLAPEGLTNAIQVLELMNKKASSELQQQVGDSFELLKHVK